MVANVYLVTRKELRILAKHPFFERTVWYFELTVILVNSTTLISF